MNTDDLTEEKMSQLMAEADFKERRDSDRKDSYIIILMLVIFVLVAIYH